MLHILAIHFIEVFWYLQVNKKTEHFRHKSGRGYDDLPLSHSKHFSQLSWDNATEEAV